METCGATSRDWLKEGMTIVVHVEKEEAMDYEYVAVSWRTANAANDDEFVRGKAQLLAQGWKVVRCAPWSRELMPRLLTGGACIMRKPKDEPRKWTRTQIENIALNMVLKEKEWGDGPKEETNG